MVVASSKFSETERVFSCKTYTNYLCCINVKKKKKRFTVYILHCLIELVSEQFTESLICSIPEWISIF